MIDCIGFAVFIGSVAVCLFRELSLTWAMCVGLLYFGIVGLCRGKRLPELWHMAWSPTKKMLSVLITYALIGSITALWRSSGTIAFCIYYGLQLITPRLFILISFLLTSGIAFAIGTSYGVVGTAGIILMALCRSGGVDPAVTAGTILAGAYCGDRCSHASSSAALVAASTDTRVEDNVKMMLRTGALPYMLSVGIYALISWRHPIAQMDDALLEMLRESFRLSSWTILPAALIILLPLCRVSVRLSMVASVVSAFCITVFLQKGEVLPTLWAAVAGYTPGDAALQTVMSGGGMVSMLTATVLCFFTAAFAGLLDGLGVLGGLRKLVDRVAARWGRFPATATAMTLCGLVFCNQSTGAVVTPQLVGQNYADASPGELAQDMENSGIIISALIPWNIALSIPLLMLDADSRAIPYAVLLYMIPVCYGFTKKHFYPKEKHEK